MIGHHVYSGTLSPNVYITRLNFELKVSPRLGSGDTAFHSDQAMIGQKNVLLDSILCFICEATVVKISSPLGSPTTLLSYTNIVYS